MKAGAVGGFWGAVGAGVSFGVGSLNFNDKISGTIGKMLAHGTSQGALTAAQGGKFQHGFFSAAFTAGFSPNMNGRSNFAKVVSSSIVGGTASVIGGGKFANGAITGAYVMLFNHMMHDGDEKNQKKSNVDSVSEETSIVYEGTYWKEGMPTEIEENGKLLVVPKTNKYTFVRDKNLRKQYDKIRIEKFGTAKLSPVDRLLEPKTMGTLDIIFQLVNPIPSLPTYRSDFVNDQERKYQNNLKYWYKKEQIIK